MSKLIKSYALNVLFIACQFYLSKTVLFCFIKFDSEGFLGMFKDISVRRKEAVCCHKACTWEWSGRHLPRLTGTDGGLQV